MNLSSRKIGICLLNFCKANNISLTEFADLICISKTEAGRVFDGRVFFTFDELKDVMFKLNTTVGELISEKYDTPLISERKRFSNSKNENFIFGLIDDFLYLKEEAKKSGI